VFAVFSETDFWLSVCFCVFFSPPETDLVEGFLWFSERNRFWVVVVGEILLLGCVVLVLWVFYFAGIVEELAPLHTPTRQKKPKKKKNKETKEEQEQGAEGREGEEMFSIGRVAMSSW